MPLNSPTQLLNIGKPPKEKPTRLKAINVAKQFADVWPFIVADKIANPTIGKVPLCNKYIEKTRLTRKAFLKRMSRAGWDDIVLKVSSTSAMSSKQETRELVKSLQEVMRHKAEKHLKKMTKYIDVSHHSLGETAERMKIDKDASKAEISPFLDNVTKLEKIGRKVFELDKDSKNPNASIINLAIVANFDPTKV